MDTGWLYGSAARNIDVGATDWINPDEAKVGDATGATCQPPGKVYTDRLNVYTFGANISSTATINGIIFSVLRKSSTPVDVNDTEIYLMDNTTPKGNNKSITAIWSHVYTYASFGSSSDLWGASWTPAQINASTFGLVIKAKASVISTIAYVDVIRVKIYYTLVSSGVNNLMMMGM